MEIPYLNGKKHGIQTIWEEDGEVIRKVNWKEDQRVR
jgi:antitoxin component YwqK of YwqJK toxin-antitoxin module